MSSGAAFFISYSRRDAASRELAHALSFELPRRGHEKVFLDVVRMRAGKWAKQLEYEIDTCDVFVILVSEKSLASKNVRRELTRALERHEKTGRPEILPIRVRFTRELEGRDSVLDEFERLEWRLEHETPHIVDRIVNLISHVVPNPDPPPPPPPPPPRWRALVKWATLTGGALLLAVLSVLSFVQVRALAGAKSDEGARVAFDRLRTLQAWLLPRLWLVGPWHPERLAEAYFTRRADAIDAVAAPMLGSRMRQEADQGLVLATLAALKRGFARGDDAAWSYPLTQNYAWLEATLRGEEPSPGTALAVWRGPRRLLIAEGTRVWSCPADDLSGCAKAELPDLDAAKDAAFVSETQLATVSVDGSVNQWDLGTFANPIASAIRQGDPGVSVAADGGDAAIVFAVAPRVMVVLANGRRISAPGNLPPVTRATFGPCEQCVTLLLNNERVVLWNYESGRQWPLTEGAMDAAATRKGFVAAAMRDGTVRFYDANRNPVALPYPLRFESIGQLTISQPGHLAAVVHDGVLSVVGDRGLTIQLIPAGRTPAPIAAAWAMSPGTAPGEFLVTRTPLEVRLWNLQRRQSVNDVAPGDAWRERRKQLGMTVDAEGKVVAGSAGPAQLGWNRARRRIESQD